MYIYNHASDFKFSEFTRIFTREFSQLPQSIVVLWKSIKMQGSTATNVHEEFIKFTLLLSVNLGTQCVAPLYRNTNGAI